MTAGGFVHTALRETEDVSRNCPVDNHQKATLYERRRSYNGSGVDALKGQPAERMGSRPGRDYFSAATYFSLILWKASTTTGSNCVPEALEISSSACQAGLPRR